MYYNICYISSVGYVLGQYIFAQGELEEFEKDAIYIQGSEQKIRYKISHNLGISGFCRPPHRALPLLRSNGTTVCTREPAP
eukprot:12729537-Ditylum_brightwellii.AAC.1